MTFTQGLAPTLLVVDDYEDNLNLLTSFLTLEGYKVLTAQTGVEAVEVAIRQRPDLILMDIALPGMDGLSAVWRIREEPEMADVPVVVISAHDSFDLRAEAAGAGCKGYLVKPLDMEEIKQLIQEILQS